MENQVDEVAWIWLTSDSLAGSYVSLPGSFNGSRESDPKAAMFASNTGPRGKC